ncbi:hypothetical protein QF037_008875 [Streptomyces canus]|nr:hypothetical protein [Streptomyces canus]
MADEIGYAGYPTHTGPGQPVCPKPPWRHHMSQHVAVQLSPEAIQFADWLAAGANPPSELDAARIQAEQVHLAAREPEGVTYREVDAGGVLGIWCEPVDANTDHVLLHTRAGGSVLASAHVDRKLAGHIAKAAGPPYWSWTSGGHRNTSTRLRSTTRRRPSTGCSPKGMSRGTSSRSATRSAGSSPSLWRFASATRSSSCPAPSCRSLPGATSKSPMRPSRPTPGPTRSSARNCWSSSGTPGSVAPASSSRTPGSI